MMARWAAPEFLWKSTVDSQRCDSRSNAIGMMMIWKFVTPATSVSQASLDTQLHPKYASVPTPMWGYEI